MGIVFRQSIKTTIVIFAGAVLGALVVGGYAYVLSKPLQGFTRTVLSVAGFLQLFALLGTGSTILTYVHRYPPGQKRKVLLTLAALVPLVTTGILLIPYLLFRNNLVHLYQPAEQGYINTYYLWIPVLVILWSYMSQLELYLSSQHRTAIATFMREVVLKFLNLILIALIGFGYISFSSFIIGTVLVYAVPTLIMLPIAMRTESFGFSMQWRVFGKQDYKELLHFSWYHLLLSVSASAMGVVDMYMLPILSKHGLSSLAVYAIAVFIASVMTAPYRAMASAAFPTLNLAYTNGDTDKVHQLFRRSSVNTLIVSVAMAVIIACNLPNAVAMLRKGQGYETIIPLVLIMMIGRLVDMASGLNTELISISKYYKFNFRISVLLVVLMVGLNLFLIPRFDVYGAAWSTTISLILFNVGKMIFLWKKMGVQPFTGKSLYVLAAGAIAGFVGYIVPALHNPFVDAVLRTGLVVVIYAVLLLWWQPSEDLRTYVQSIRKDKRLF